MIITIYEYNFNTSFQKKLCFLFDNFASVALHNFPVHWLSTSAVPFCFPSHMKELHCLDASDWFLLSSSELQNSS